MKKAISHSADRFCYENWKFEVKVHIGMFSSFILRFQVDLTQFGTYGASRVFNTKFFAVMLLETTYTSLAVGLVGKLEFSHLLYN